MKKEYSKPMAEKLVFDYTENIVASGNDNQIVHHGAMGIGLGGGGGCDHDPGHGNPHKPHPGNGNGNGHGNH